MDKTLTNENFNFKINEIARTILFKHTCQLFSKVKDTFDSIGSGVLILDEEGKTHLFSAAHVAKDADYKLYIGISTGFYFIEGTYNILDVENIRVDFCQIEIKEELKLILEKEYQFLDYKKVTTQPVNVVTTSTNEYYIVGYPWQYSKIENFKYLSDAIIINASETKKRTYDNYKMNDYTHLIIKNEVNNYFNSRISLQE